MKRNKIRYQSKPKDIIPITLTGKLFLQYRDDEEIERAQKGDLLVFAENEQLHTTRQGQYDATGFTGYFKVDVSDGAQWCAVHLNEIFPEHENHFSRTEKPIDTFQLCEGILKALAGKRVIRTYREHYILETVEEA